MKEFEYKSNSHKSKEVTASDVTEKKVEKAISGKARVKDKSGIQKFTDVFISEDAGSVKNYILMEVLIPSFKKAISDIVTNGIDMILYGQSGVSKRNNTPASKVSYRSYYDRPQEQPNYYQRSAYDYKNIVLDTRVEAQEVLTRMDEIISMYGMVSVADLYDLVGITGEHTDNKYGWKDIRMASVVHVRDGFLLKFPRPLPFD